MNKDFTQQKGSSDTIRIIMFAIFALYVFSGMVLITLEKISKSEHISTMPYLLSIYFLVDFLVGIVTKEFYTFGFMIKRNERPVLFWLRGFLVLGVAVAVFLMLSLFK